MDIESAFVITYYEQSRQIESGAVQTNLQSKSSAEQVCVFLSVLCLVQHKSSSCQLYQNLCTMI